MCELFYIREKNMLKDVTFPVHRRFKSRTDWEPIGFFSDCLCNSTKFDLMLGFFSSSAINVLADGFASFLYNECSGCNMQDNG